MAMADRLSALLAEDVAREARRAGLSERTNEPTIIRPLHSDLLGSQIRSGERQIHTIDTTQMTRQAVADAVLDWCRRALAGDAPTLRPTASETQ